MRKGVYVANLTPFKDGAVDLARLKKHAEFLLSNGIAGFCPCGTTGEFVFLSQEEKKGIYRTLGEICDKRAELICGSWAENSQKIIQLSNYAKDHGASAVFFTTPIFHELTDREIQRYYQLTARKIDLPVYCYNIPNRAHNQISLSTIEYLVVNNLVVGIKDSSRDEPRIKEIIARFSGKINIFCGGDNFILKARQMGADGFITGLGNIFPREVVKVWQEGDPAVQDRLIETRDIIKTNGGYTAMKYLLNKLGFDFGIRPPYLELAEEQKKNLDCINLV